MTDNAADTRRADAVPPADPDTAGAAALVDDPVELARFSRAAAGPQGQRWQESTLRIGGMVCAACSGLVEGALTRVDGVAQARVSAASERATVLWDPARTRASALIDAVRRAGYEAVPDAAAPARELRRREQRQALWRLFVAWFCMMQVMMLATPGYIAGPGELAEDLRRLLNWGSWVLTLPVVAFACGPFLRGAWRSLKARRIGMDVPVALGIVITFIASTGATFDPGGIFGREVYFDSLTMFVAFLLAARWVEAKARARAAEALEAGLARLPERAQRVRADGTLEAVPLHRLRRGDRVRVAVGDAFAADGVIEDGRTAADESMLTGESTPVPRGVGDTAIAGSINLGAPVTLRVERAGADTRYEAVVSMMRDALTQRPAAARLADRWAAPFLWIVLALAAGSAAVWSVIDPSRAVWVAVAVLIVTCPCALSLAAPTALVAAARGLARNGIVLQRLDAVATLATAERLFVDKTGTLTEGRPRGASMRLTAAGEGGCGEDWLPRSDTGDDTPSAAVPDTPARTAEAVAAHAASLARWSRHPLAQAVAEAAPAGHGDAVVWRGVHEIPAQGVEAVDGRGVRWRLGHPAWVADGGAAAVAAPPAGGSSTARVAFGPAGSVWAEWRFDEPLRDGAAEALRALRADGLEVTLLTGDNAERAHALAQRVGIDDVIADARPQDKLDAVARAQQRGQRVLMVGDGINDGPVLARADGSFAMGQGALLARTHADGVIVSGRLHDLVLARQRARRAVAIVAQNLRWAVAYNAVGIPLAVIGWLPPWVAGLGMAASSLVVVLNALRAAR